MELYDLDEARETAQDTYGELVEVLVENDLMTRDANYNHDLDIGFDSEHWGDDCPSPFTQAAIIEAFFRKLADLTPVEVLTVVAAYLKHANADNYVTICEEEALENAAAESGLALLNSEAVHRDGDSEDLTLEDVR